MKTRWTKKLTTMLLIGGLAVMVPEWAMALTPACTPIANQATLAYRVGGVSQTDKNSNSVSFVVANKVDHTVTRTAGTYVGVTPGENDAALGFTVTNNGNANQTYKITFVTQATSATDAFGGTDNFDATTPGINANSTATVTSGVIAPGGTYSPTIVSDIALSRVLNDKAGYALIATAYKVDGTTKETVSSSSVTSTYGTCTTDVVLADAAGSDDTTGAKDGEHSIRHAYNVVSANLTFGKTVTTIWDPINLATSPKAIPGAYVRYEISLANAAGAASATLTTITDTLVATLLMDPDFKNDFSTPATPAAESAAGSGFKVRVTGGTRAGDSSGLVNNVYKYYTTTSSADGVDLSGQTITATAATFLPIDAGGGSAYTAGELKAGETLTITFIAIVQ